MAQSRNAFNTEDSGDQASWELVDADPGNAVNATIQADNISTDEPQRRESRPSQENPEATGPPQKKQRRDKAAKPGASGKVGGLIRPFMVYLLLGLVFAICVRHVVHVHEGKIISERELDRASVDLYVCRMQLKDMINAWSSLTVEWQNWVTEEASKKQHSRFRLFG